MSTIRATNFQHASATNPAIVLAADGTAAATVSDINGGPLAGFRNAIINGGFDYWQRGTSFTGYVYGADRWQNARVGSTCTMSRQGFIPGQTDVPGEPTYFCRMAVSSVAGAGNHSILIQPIEDVRTFAGQQITISFWAKADGSKPIAIELLQNFGTGGTPSGSVTGIGVTKKTLSTSWQKVTTTVSVPSISGKTLGTDNNSNLALFIWFDGGSNFNARTNSLGQQSGTFDIAQVQVEAGPVATPFEHRPQQVEAALCQRYFWRNEFNATYNFFATAANQYTSWIIHYPVAMRGVPSVSMAFDLAGSYGIGVSPTVNEPNTLTCKMALASSGAGTNLYVRFTAGANGFIQADAEL